MPKVYLSSTLLDLKDERQVVTDWLIAAGYQPVHSYVADSETVRDSCLEDIAGCDFYVLIVGHHHGYQPVKRNPRKCSITQLEFHKAGKQRITRLAFLRTSVPDIHLSDLNDPDRMPRVQAFRKEVAEALRAAEFKEMTEFVAAFSAAIQQHILKRLRMRDAQAQDQAQLIEQLERELDQGRNAAVGRVLDAAEQPNAGDLAMHARQALLMGDSARAEEFLLKKENLAADAMEVKRHEAADLARQIAALATGRDSQSVLAALERAVRYEPEDFATLIQLGDAQAVLGASGAAMNSFEKSRKIRETLAAGDPANTQGQRELSLSHNKIGDVLMAQGQGTAAMTAYRQGLAIAETLAALDPGNAEWQRDLIISQVKLGEGTGDMAYTRRALEIAPVMQTRGLLAPRDAWMVADLERRVAQAEAKP